jgi:hypothetical protein
MRRTKPSPTEPLLLHPLPHESRQVAAHGRAPEAPSKALILFSAPLTKCTWQGSVRSGPVECGRAWRADRRRRGITPVAFRLLCERTDSRTAERAEYNREQLAPDAAWSVVQHLYSAELRADDHRVFETARRQHVLVLKRVLEPLAARAALERTRTAAAFGAHLRAKFSVACCSTMAFVV